MKKKIEKEGETGVGKLSWYAVNMTSCSRSCWRQRKGKELRLRMRLWLRLRLRIGQDSGHGHILNSCVYVRVGCVCFCAVCHFGNCTDCTTVTERAASVCFNFSYRQPAASASVTTALLHLILLQPLLLHWLPLLLLLLLLVLWLLPSAIQF